MESQKGRLSILPSRLEIPAGIPHITTATAATILHLKTGKASPKNRSHRKGLVNHCPGLGRKRCLVLSGVAEAVGTHVAGTAG